MPGTVGRADMVAESIMKFRPQSAFGIALWLVD